MYEIHVAIKQIPALHMVLALLKEAGIVELDFFRAVINLPADGTQPQHTPPTGHDLDNPAAMATTQTDCLQTALELIRKAMTILGEHAPLHSGNFEIEEIARATEPGTTADIPSLLSEFSVVEDSPAFENHVIWNGTASTLPSYDQIIKLIVAAYGFKPHQIVDFASEEQKEDTETISRVATIYQPNREATLHCAKVLSANEKTFGCTYTVAERVHMVGV
jgi:hypothetical protein